MSDKKNEQNFEVELTLQSTKQLPISVQADHKSDVRTQFAALCYRVVKDQVQVLLVTSRGRQRWILPKGWPMDGKTPGECAAIEAWEEAGVVGKPSDRCLGIFSYAKIIDEDTNLPCIGMVFPVKVKSLKNDFPEAKQRRRKWVSLKKAAKLLSEPELIQIVKTFEPRQIHL